MVENEQRAREVAAYRQEQATAKRTATAPASLDTMFSGAQRATVIEFPVVVKADVQGSVEAIVTALHNLSNDEIKVRVLHSGVGAITESDVTLAARQRRADHRLQRPPQRQGARAGRARTRCG